MFTQSMTFIGSLEEASLETSIRRSAGATRYAQRPRQRAYAFGIHTAINTGLHGLPDVTEVLFNLFLCYATPVRFASPCRK